MGHTMTLDNGWALIIATVIGVVLVWVGNLVGKHFDNTEGDNDQAHKKIEKIFELIAETNKAIAAQQLESSKYQTHVAENYARITMVERLETNLFSVVTRLEQKVDELLRGSKGSQP
jgi:hypothetical protein